MAGTKLYLRNVSTISHPVGLDSVTKSVALPIGTNKGGTGGTALDLTTAKGTAEVSDSYTTGTVAAQTSGVIRKWVSNVLGGGDILPQNWTVGISVLENNAAANYFLALSIYVIKADGTVRGFIYDSSTALGAEFPTTSTGRVQTVAGAAVTGVLNTDQLVVEVWGQGIQTLTTSRTITFKWDGTTDPTDGVTTTDCAAYIQAAVQDIFTATLLSTLTTGTDVTGATSSTTASVTPTASVPHFLAVWQRTGITADPNTPTVTGAGLTWVQITTIVFDTTSSSRRRLTVFKAVGGSPSAGALTIDYGGQAQTDVIWVLLKAATVDATTPTIQNPTLVDETGVGTTKTITMAAFANVLNVPLVFWGTTDSSNTPTAGSGFAIQNRVSSGANGSLTAEFGAANDNTADMSFINAADQYGAIALELKLGASGSVNKGAGFFALAAG